MLSSGLCFLIFVVMVVAGVVLLVRSPVVSGRAVLPGVIVFPGILFVLTQIGVAEPGNHPPPAWLLSLFMLGCVIVLVGWLGARLLRVQGTTAQQASYVTGGRRAAGIFMLVCASLLGVFFIASLVRAFHGGSGDA